MTSSAASGLKFQLLLCVFTISVLVVYLVSESVVSRFDVKTYNDKVDGLPVTQVEIRQQ